MANPDANNDADTSININTDSSRYGTSANNTKLAINNNINCANNTKTVIENGASKSSTVGYVYSPRLMNNANLLPSNRFRSTIVHSLIQAYGLCKHLKIIPPVKTTLDDLTEFHSIDYIQFITSASALQITDNEEFTNQCADFGLTDDCTMFPGISQYIHSIAGASLACAHGLMAGYSRMINWDGGRHHSKKSTANGFCYVNDIVLCILKLQNVFPMILYLDVDVHHGDGVAEAFAYTRDVYTCSFHLKDTGFFPGTGSTAECGAGDGIHATLNVPLKPGLETRQFKKCFESVVARLINAYKPSAIVMQCGCDGISGDPLGQWNLGVEAIPDAVAFVAAYNIPTVFLGGGGYINVNAARCWASCTAKIVGVEIEHEIPEHVLWPMYKSGYTLDIERRNGTDANLEDLDLVIGTAWSQIDKFGERWSDGP